MREFTGQSLTLSDLSQLLWSAQGITHRAGYRTAPSAGALYPLELYVVAGNVARLAPGMYQYRPHGHTLVLALKGDQRGEVRQAALGQEAVAEAAAVFVFCGVFERTSIKYGPRATRYVHMEAGHSAQNLYLQAVTLGLGTVVIGAFHDDHVKRVLGLSGKEQPLYLMPIGAR